MEKPKFTTVTIFRRRSLNDPPSRSEPKMEAATNVESNTAAIGRRRDIVGRPNSPCWWWRRAEDMIAELKAEVFPTGKVRYTRLTAEGTSVGVV